MGFLGFLFIMIIRHYLKHSFPYHNGLFAFYKLFMWLRPEIDEKITSFLVYTSKYYQQYSLRKYNLNVTRSELPLFDFFSQQEILVKRASLKL